MLIERLCKQAGLTRSQLDSYAKTASKRYKTFPIAKRDGTARLISQPSREIKAIQRWLNRVVFRKFPVHPSATAYAKGSSIRENAERHVGSNFTLRVDFKDFFPSFSAGDVSKFIHDKNNSMNMEMSDEDIDFIVNIVSRFGVLTIGAPSSPILTNTMMYSFDDLINQWAVERDCVYTRYADDIFLSSRRPENLAGGAEAVARFSKSHEYGSLNVKPEKTVFLSRRARRTVTGLVITTDRKISIGRDRKREIKGLIYLQKLGVLEVGKLSYLRGMLAFVADVEPAFRDALSRKFGGDLLSAIESGIAVGAEDPASGLPFGRPQ